MRRAVTVTPGLMNPVTSNRSDTSGQVSVSNESKASGGISNNSFSFDGGVTSRNVKPFPKANEPPLYGIQSTVPLSTVPLPHPSLPRPQSRALNNTICLSGRQHLPVPPTPSLNLRPSAANAVSGYRNDSMQTVSSAFPASFSSSSASTSLNQSHPFKEASSTENSSASSSAFSSDSDCDATTSGTSAIERRGAIEAKATQNQSASAAASVANIGLQFRQRRYSNTSQNQTNPEDDDRKRIRRERNKAAAARCRQRRVDLTNSLLFETESLDAVRVNLEKEVEDLMRQKNQLQFVLQTHITQCQILHSPPYTSASNPTIKLESPDEFFQGPSSLSSSYPLQSIASSTVRPNSLQVQMASSATPMSSMNPTCQTFTPQMISGIGHTDFTLNPLGNSLEFGLESMLDGHTGLTPVTELLPSTSTSINGISCNDISPTLLNL